MLSVVDNITKLPQLNKKINKAITVKIRERQYLNLVFNDMMKYAGEMSLD